MMVKLHLGCGWRNFGKEWVHIDGGVYDHLVSDSITKLDYEDNSVDLIYASHVIAYFNREEIVDVFNEWFRVLKPNGVLRIATPDIESIMGLYMDGKNLSSFLGPIFGKMSMGTNTIYHKTAYDFTELRNVLTYCGFKGIDLYNWMDTDHSQFDDHSQAYIPHMDKENGKLISLNIECKK
jgi:predicted SAM-dependent methyltransferase